jgi:hypothetical protein
MPTKKTKKRPSAVSFELPTEPTSAAKLSSDKAAGVKSVISGRETAVTLAAVTLTITLLSLYIVFGHKLFG